MTFPKMAHISESSTAQNDASRATREPRRIGVRPVFPDRLRRLGRHADIRSAAVVQRRLSRGHSGMVTGTLWAIGRGSSSGELPVPSTISAIGLTLPVLGPS